MNRKRLLKMLLGFGLVTCIGLAGGYYVLQKKIQELPLFVQTELSKTGIELKYLSFETSKMGLALTLQKPSISGKNLPITFSAESFQLSLLPAFAIPPLTLAITFNSSNLNKNETYSSPGEAQKEGKRSHLNIGWLSAASYLIRIQLNLNSLDSKDFGISGLSATLHSKLMDLGSLTYTIDVEKFSALPWLVGFHSGGNLLFSGNEVQLSQSQTGVGPFLVDADGTFNLTTQQWQTTLKVPESPIDSTSKRLNLKALDQVSPKSGIVNLSLVASGVGSKKDTIQAKGELKLKNGTLDFKLPNLKGLGTASVDASFSYNKTLVLKGELDVDLKESEISYDDVFRKKSGTPSRLLAQLSGDESHIQLHEGKVLFHNLTVNAEGTYSQPAGLLNLSFNVPEVSLLGWESFFPKYSEAKTQGTLSLKGRFNGPSNNLAASDLLLDIQAKKTRFPILKAWLPKESISISGLVDIDSVTKIELSKSVLKSLSTNTSIDLTKNSVQLKNGFSKPEGTTLRTNLLVSSDSKQAVIKSGTLELNGDTIYARGKVSRFLSPLVQLSLRSNKIGLSNFGNLIEKNSPVSAIGGDVTVNADVSGPLLDPKQLRYSGLIRLFGVRGNYMSKEHKRPILLKNLVGDLQFTNQSLSSNRLAVQFPKTDGLISLKVSSFQPLIGQVSLRSKHFALDDFYLAPTHSTPPPPGAVPPPSEALRKNPVLKEAKLDFRFVSDSADLQFVKANKVKAEISLNKLALTVKPSLEIYEGKISGTTVWNGQLDNPVTTQTLQVEDVNANQFLSYYSDKARDLIEGKFSSQMNLTFSGEEPEEIKKSLSGAGSFKLTNGKLKTIRFTKGPLESMKQIPVLGKHINQTDWNENLNEASGRFNAKNGSLTFSDVVIHAPYFDVTAKQATLDLEKKISSDIIFTPKQNLLPTDAMEMLKDANGAVSLPLKLAGSLLSPSVELDSNIVSSRIKEYGERRLAAEKNKLATDAQKRAGEEVKKHLNQGLGNLFK